MRHITEVLALGVVLSATALPQGPRHTTTAPSATQVVSRAFSADLRQVTDADPQEVILKSKRPVAVVFGAGWCGSCNVLTPFVDRLAQPHPEILAERLDVDENQATPAKYDVKDLPTIMVFRKGKVATKIIGAKWEALPPILKKASPSPAQPSC